MSCCYLVFVSSQERVAPFSTVSLFSWKNCLLSDQLVVVVAVAFLVDCFAFVASALAVSYFAAADSAAVVAAGPATATGAGHPDEGLAAVTVQWGVACLDVGFGVALLFALSFVAAVVLTLYCAVAVSLQFVVDSAGELAALRVPAADVIASVDAVAPTVAFLALVASVFQAD